MGKTAKQGRANRENSVNTNVPATPDIAEVFIVYEEETVVEAVNSSVSDMESLEAKLEKSESIQLDSLSTSSFGEEDPQRFLLQRRQSSSENVIFDKDEIPYSTRLSKLKKLSSDSTTNVNIAVGNIMHDHNLAKNSENNSNKNIVRSTLPPLQEEVLLKTEMLEPCVDEDCEDFGNSLTKNKGLSEGRMVYSTVDGELIEITKNNVTEDSQNQLVQSNTDTDTTAQFLLPPGYQLVNISPTIPSLPLTEETGRSAETQEHEISDSPSNTLGVLDANLTTPSNNWVNELPTNNLNSVVTVQIANGKSLLLHRFYYQKGMCRICLNVKESTTSIFEDVSVDCKGIIENSRGPYPVRYNIIPAMKTLLDVDVSVRINSLS